MEKLSNVTPNISGALATLGAVGGAIAAAFGGWDSGMALLMICMAGDYASGLVVAGVFKKSTKSATGALESRAGWKGLCRKGATLLIVLIAARLDGILGAEFIRDSVVIAYIANEAISIIENVGLMGVPIPAILRKAIDILSKKSEPPAAVTGADKEGK